MENLISFGSFCKHKFKPNFIYLSNNRDLFLKQTIMPVNELLLIYNDLSRVPNLFVVILPHSLNSH